MSMKDVLFRSNRIFEYKTVSIRDRFFHGSKTLKNSKTMKNDIVFVTEFNEVARGYCNSDANVSVWKPKRKLKLIYLNKKNIQKLINILPDDMMINPEIANVAFEKYLKENMKKNYHKENAERVMKAPYKPIMSRRYAKLGVLEKIPLKKMLEHNSKYWKNYGNGVAKFKFDSSGQIVNNGIGRGTGPLKSVLSINLPSVYVKNNNVYRVSVDVPDYILFHHLMPLIKKMGYDGIYSDREVCELKQNILKKPMEKFQMTEGCVPNELIMWNTDIERTECKSSPVRKLKQYNKNALSNENRIRHVRLLDSLINKQKLEIITNAGTKSIRWKLGSLSSGKRIASHRSADGVIIDQGTIIRGQRVVTKIIFTEGQKSVSYRNAMGEIAITKRMGAAGLAPKVYNSYVTKVRTDGQIKKELLKNDKVNLLHKYYLPNRNFDKKWCFLIIMENLNYSGRKAVESLTLNSAVRAGKKIPTKKIKHMISEITDMGIIHGDLHGGNIMIVYNGNGNVSRVRFIDFGRSFQVNGNVKLNVNNVNDIISNQGNYQFGMSMENTLKMLNNLD